MKIFKQLTITTLFIVTCSCQQKKVYEPTWESVNQHNAAPEWFRDAKFGIYYHWGAYCVPAYGNEWYVREMHFDSSDIRTEHIKRFGEPSEFAYHDFILGKEDKEGNFMHFAPKLKSEGGNFDPEEWADLIYRSGAKFAGNVAEHHDGYSMWASETNPWNTKDLGPKLDLVGIMAKELRKKGLKIIETFHHSFNIRDFVPTDVEADPPAKSIADNDTLLMELYGKLPEEKSLYKWNKKLEEVIDNYQPDIIWFDFKLDEIPEKNRLEFLSYYFNRAEEWDKEVVVTYKQEDLNRECGVEDFERGGPTYLTDYTWLTDDAISRTTWSYTEGMTYYSPKSILHAFIDRVSKNGQLLLNISPMADGTIPQEQKDILLCMGDWLDKYGEAIYATRPWNRYGYGPTKLGGPGFARPQEMTNKDVRFTRNKDNNTLYAILMGWPENSKLNIEILNTRAFDLSNLEKIELMNTVSGNNLPISFRQDTKGLTIVLPKNKPVDELAYVVKMKFKKTVPPYQKPIAQRAPFHKRPPVIPGIIESEDFDKGEEGDSYHDTEAGNIDGKYRLDIGVDIQDCKDGGYCIGWVEEGEWLEYTVEVEKDGDYELELRYGCHTEKCKLNIEFDGENKTGTWDLKNTYGWQEYQSAKKVINLSAGKHIMRVNFMSHINLDKFVFNVKE